MAKSKIEQQHTELLLELNKMLLNNNLDNEIVFKFNNIFYNYGSEEYNKGKETIKEIYNL